MVAISPARPPGTRNCRPAIPIGVPRRYLPSVTSDAEVPGTPQSPPTASDVTLLLRASSGGATDARDRLLEFVYEDLHAMARARMAGERADHTLGATALVNEAYLRLFRESGGDEGTTASPARFADRSVFLAAAANTMRRVLIDHARGRLAAKRGGKADTEGRHRWRRVPLDAMEAVRGPEPELVLELDDAVESLEAIDPRAAEVVRLRFYVGLELTEIAGLLGVSDRTCKRDWAFARAWLHDALQVGEPGDPGDPGLDAAGSTRS